MDSFSSNANAMNILQQFSQLLFLQSLAAAGSSSMPMNSGMFGFPLSQYPSMASPSNVTPLLPPPSPPTTSTSAEVDPSIHLQTISDLLSSPSTLKSQILSSPYSPNPSSETFKFYNNVQQPHQQRQYKVPVTRESAKPLQEWMSQHITDPYPSQSDVRELSAQTGFTYKQIRNWFTNNRRKYELNSGSSPIPWIKKDAPKISTRTILCKSESESSETSVDSILL